MSALQRILIYKCFIKHNIYIIKQRKHFLFLNYTQSEVVGSSPITGDEKNSYCGKSSDNLFWTHWDLKKCPVLSKVDCKNFYVNWTSSLCDKLYPKTDIYLWDNMGLQFATFHYYIPKCFCLITNKHLTTRQHDNSTYDEQKCPNWCFFFF